MSNTVNQSITIQTTVNAPIEKVWETWSRPEHITKWNAASEDWHTPRAENDLRTGGKFSSRMEAKDGSFGFDFAGVYDNVEDHKLIEYKLGDERKVRIEFQDNDDTTTIIEQFDAESQHSIEMQQAGWQAILDNFKKYTESLA
ncbi:MAG: polyketide cyclase [Chitinophagaceae bacterium]|nr:MAG: polyketide cyclase [Chitinophagaceae bacterium]